MPTTVVQFEPNARGKQAFHKHTVTCAACNLHELCLSNGFNEEEFQRVERLVYARRRVKDHLLRFIALPASMAAIEGLGGRVGIPDPVVAVASVATFLSGITGPIVLSMASGLQQAMAPPDMRARLAALGTTITFGTQPFVSLAVGYAGEVFGAPTALLLTAGVLTGLVILLVAFRPSVRAEVIRPNTMVSPPATPPPPESAPPVASVSTPDGDGTTGTTHSPAAAVLATAGAPPSGHRGAR